MRTPIQALLWELWRTSRLQLLMVVGGQIAFAMLLYRIFVISSTAASAFSQSWRNSFESRYIGFSFHLGFTRPISTIRLVAIPMLFVVITAPLCYLLPA